MTALANIVIAIVAILHLGFLALEMFFWNHPFGRKRFGMTPEYSQASASLRGESGTIQWISRGRLDLGTHLRCVLYKIIFPDLCHHCRDLWCFDSEAIHSLYTSIACPAWFDFALSIQVNPFYEQIALDKTRRAGGHYRPYSVCCSGHRLDFCRSRFHALHRVESIWQCA